MPTGRSSSEKCCGILLAAGAGSRFRASEHKLLAILRGRPVYCWAFDAVVSAGLDAVIIVTGAASLDPTTMPEATIVHNPDWASGQATSLQCARRAAEALGMDAMVVGLADQPFITAAAWRSVANAPADIAVATYDGRRGNPVLLRRAIWPLLPSEGDQGARSLMTRRPDLVVEVACTGSPADIDTMEDLQQWNSSTNSP